MTPSSPSLEPLKKLVSCIDLTLLSDGCNNNDVIALCAEANTPLGPTAAICVYPAFVSTAWKQLVNSPIKIATVANFPFGDQSLEIVIHTIQQALLDGAEEIDIVMPQNALKQKDTRYLNEFMQEIKKQCNEKLVLKIILETGQLEPDEIVLAAECAIQHGADFLKTSTGKTSVGATPFAAQLLLDIIQHHCSVSNKLVGLKLSGGIKKIEQAISYMDLAEKTLGKTFLTSQFFRIGASSLLQEIITCVSQNQS